VCCLGPHAHITSETRLYCCVAADWPTHTRAPVEEFGSFAACKVHIRSTAVELRGAVEGSLLLCIAQVVELSGKRRGVEFQIKRLKTETKRYGIF
jgi:hypothetical protein